jgi:ribosomal protein S18 acetylase RimI-like enzyme
MRTAFADSDDLDYLARMDARVREDVLRQKIERREIIVGWSDDRRSGWLRYGYFWDEVPFMNMLYVHEGLRGQGIGTRLVASWEERMRDSGHGRVMTSTLSNETAQHFYRKLGYEDCGCLLLPGEPTEIVFTKELM